MYIIGGLICFFSGRAILRKKVIKAWMDDEYVNPNSIAIGITICTAIPLVNWVVGLAILFGIFVISVYPLIVKISKYLTDDN